MASSSRRPGTWDHERTENNNNDKLIFIKGIGLESTGTAPGPYPRTIVREYGASGLILVQVTIYRRFLIGRDGHLDLSESYDIS